MLLIWNRTGAASDIEKDVRQLSAGTAGFNGIFAEAAAGPSGRAVILAHGMEDTLNHRVYGGLISITRTGNPL